MENSTSLSILFGQDETALPPTISAMLQLEMDDWNRTLSDHHDKLIEDGIDPELAAITCRPPRTRGQFVEFIERALSYGFTRGDIVLATDVLSNTIPDAETCVPADWMWEIYCLANGRSSDGQWRLLSEKEISRAKREFLLRGPRGGSKTEGIAALWWTICWFAPRYSVTHTSTERAQSLTCLEYVICWGNSRLFGDLVSKANSVAGAHIKNGSRFVVRTGSLDGLNHEHTISLSLDEVETFPLDLIGQAMQIPQQQVGSPYPSIILMASTQKKPNLGMATHIKDAVTKGKYRYMAWNCWDVGQRCQIWRRENLPAEISCEDYEAIHAEIKSLESHTRLHDDELFYQRLLEYRTILEGNCALVADCAGRLINGTGHLDINTLITRITTLDRDTWEAENLCGSPSRTGTIYSRLSTANQNEAAVYVDGETVYAGVDYGLVGALTVVTFFGLNDAYIDCFQDACYEQMFEEDLVPEFVDFQHKYGVKLWTVDGNAINLIKKMKNAGLKVAYSSRRPKITKIDHAAKFICDGRGFRRLRFHPVNAYNTFNQLLYYGYKKDGKTPQEEDDDYCDSTIYGLEPIRTRHARPLERKNSRRPVHSLGGIPYR
jgi:hypothetical protein